MIKWVWKIHFKKLLAHLPGANELSAVVWEWMSNCILQKPMYVINYPCTGFSDGPTNLLKAVPGIASSPLSSDLIICLFFRSWAATKIP